jgi:diguanylate cyclase (GGDEF)-like protein
MGLQILPFVTLAKQRERATAGRVRPGPARLARHRLQRVATALILFATAAGLGWGQTRSQVQAAPPTVFDGKASDIIFEHLSENNGLANPVVTCFAEDGDGFLWVGSQSGLQRWDGYRFWTYKQVLGSKDSLPDNLVQTLHTDSQGRLWVGTSSGGLAMYDRLHDRFVRYRLSPSDLNRVIIFSIVDDGARGLWIGSDTGLDHLDTDSGKFTHVELAAKDGRIPRHASAVLREADGTLWVGTELGLQRSVNSSVSDPAKSVFQEVPLPVAKGATSEVTVLLRDSEGRIWIGTAHGAYVIERPNGPLAEPAHETGRSRTAESSAWLAKAVTGRGPGSEMLATQHYLSIAQASDGEVWLGTQDEGVFAVDADGPEAAAGGAWQVRHIHHDGSAPTSLSDDTVWALYLGRPGIMWAGTNRGASYLDTTQKGTFTILGGSGPSARIRDTNVYSVLARRDGSVWLALSRGGIDILDASGRKAAELRTGKENAQTTLPPGSTNGLVEAGDGSVFIPTPRGLYRATPVEKPGGGQGTPRVEQVPLGAEASKDIIRALPDGDKLWIGGADGLWLFDGKGPARRPEMQRALTDQRITVLMRGAGPVLWIGTQNGLNRLDLTTHAVETILPNAADPAGLGAGYISSLITDRQGRLWVGTFSGGIDILEEPIAQGHARFHRIIDGLPNENVDKLIEAEDGRIWAAMDGGLAVIDPKTLTMQVLRYADGAVLPAYWNDSGAMTVRGDLIFGGIGGVTVVRPQLVKSWQYQPPVVVTNARIGKSDVPTSRFNSGLGEYPVWIPPDQNNLTVEFTALDYTAPDRNRYEYKLDGFDKDWIPADATRRLARYTNLPPGNYVLELRGSNRDGVWAPARQVRVRVLPAWFQTWWFKVLAVLMVLLLLYLMFLLTTAYLRRQQRELERQVALRTSELQQMTVELQESQQKLEHMAYTDALTGLPNRRMFTEHFRRLLALKRRQDGSFSVLLMDFDAFKQINDTHGHDAGDFVLMEMARRMSALVRESDCLARLGGDEFGLILGQSHDFDGTESVCRKVIESFADPAVFEGTELRTAPSIGIAIYPFDGDTQDALYKAADLALYQAKRGGGNRCAWSEQSSSVAGD